MFHGREMRGIRILVIFESTGFFLVESSCSEEFGLISTFLLGVFKVLNCVVLREKRILRVGIGGSSNPGCGFYLYFCLFFCFVWVFFIEPLLYRSKRNPQLFISIRVGGTGKKNSQ